MESNTESHMYLKQLVDKVMSDYKFYQAFKKDPVTTLQEQGVELNQEQIKALNKISWDVLDKLAEVFGYRVT